MFICLDKFKLCLFSVPTSYRSNLCMSKTAFFRSADKCHTLAGHNIPYAPNPKKKLRMSMCPKIGENRMSQTLLTVSNVFWYTYCEIAQVQYYHFFLCTRIAAL